MRQQKPNRFIRVPGGYRPHDCFMFAQFVPFGIADDDGKLTITAGLIVELGAILHEPMRPASAEQSQVKGAMAGLPLKIDDIFVFA